ncbi:MAG: hypothetical protein IJA75_00585 [Oscillospiraceae bacterium]|nr:hypothetical protein [Oscillospiraceae bacterium]
MKKKKTALLIAAAVLLAAAIFIAVYCSTHVFVGGNAYKKAAASLDLCGRPITFEEFDQLTASLPDCTIRWDVPFQSGSIPSDTREITVTGLVNGDIVSLSYFPELEAVHAEGCTDYPQIMELIRQYPDLKVDYTVMIDGTPYPQDAGSITISGITDEEIALLSYLPVLTSVDAHSCTDLPQMKKLQEAYPGVSADYAVSINGESYTRSTSNLELTGADSAQLIELFWHLPDLKTVKLNNPAGSPDDLKNLISTYPGISFFWQSEVMGISVTSTDTEVDFTGKQPESLEEVEAALACYPNLEKVILCGMDFDNETMAAFREKMRPEYKVVWDVQVGLLTVRTDETTFMPSKYKVGCTDEDAVNLRYCEDMVCIDLGHKGLTNCKWAAYMPHLKYLIIADTLIEDISPLANHMELIYLEMFITKVKDYSPLLTCTNLEDLNLCYTHGDPEPVKQMTWLKRLWWADSPIEVEEFQTYLPDTQLMFLHHSSTGNGWRQGQHYYDMRDMLGMHYMWG